MLLPVGDAPNLSGTRPLVNGGLVLANGAVFLLLLATSRGEEAWQRAVLAYGFVPVDPALPAFFTSMFVHADAWHLLGNLLFLWIFGDNVEGRLGHLGYLLAYLASGLAAILLFWALSPESTTPLVGASGAIFGVLGFYLVAFGGNRVKVFFWFLVFGVFWVPARVVLGVALLLNLVLMLRPEGAEIGGGIAYAAHVGGAALGVVLAAVVRAPARA